MSYLLVNTCAGQELRRLRQIPVCVPAQQNELVLHVEKMKRLYNISLEWEGCYSIATIWKDT